MGSGMVKNAYVSALISFAALARFGKMTETVNFLGVSRQTIGRHMDYLDEHLGGPVVRSMGRNHSVTPRGEELLGGAEALLEQVQSMSSVGGLTSMTSGGLQSVWLSTEESEFRGQQHPLWRINQDSPEIVQQGFSAWKDSNHDILAPKVAEMMPYMLTFRRSPGGWVCSHVGEKSAYADWFGWQWAKSAVGSFAADAISGNDYFRFCSVGYLNVMNSGECRLDHHDIVRATKGRNKFQDIRYHRLCMSFLLPNREPILGTLVCRTDAVDIAEKRLSAIGKTKP